MSSRYCLRGQRGDGRQQREDEKDQRRQDQIALQAQRARRASPPRAARRVIVSGLAPETGRRAADKARPPSARRSASRRSPGRPCVQARGPSSAAEYRPRTNGRAYRRGRSSSAAMKAPRIEPMPPMTMTTKARMRMLSPMPGLDRDDRRDHDAGKSRQHGAEAEHDHEQPLDIDAERRDHAGIGGARAHQHADPGVCHQHVKPGRDRRGRTR